MCASRELVDKNTSRFPEALEILEEGLENSLSFYDFSIFDTRKISATNGLESLNREIRRPSVVVGVFQSEESYFRFVVTYLMEYAECWSTNRYYLRPATLADFMMSFRPAV
jgi:putative transposase